MAYSTAEHAENQCPNDVSWNFGASDDIVKKRVATTSSVRRQLGTDFGRQADARLSDAASENSLEARIPFMPISTEEAQQRYMARKRQELADQRKQNERSCYDAIHFPHVHGNSDASLNASRSNRSVLSGRDSVPGSESRGRSSSRIRQPELTVPEGPNLRTQTRAASRSLSRQSATHSVHRSTRGLAMTPGSCRSDMSLCSVSPARSNASRQSGRGRPIGTRNRLQGQYPVPSPAGSHACSVRSGSDMSIASIGSRLSRSSVRSNFSCLSTEDRQLSEARIGRLDLENLMAHNKKHYRAALANPDITIKTSNSFTMPEEFNLSVSNLPRCRSRCGSVSSRRSEGSNFGQPSSRRRAWKPELTVSRGPCLRTTQRAYSASARRSRVEHSSRSLSASRSSRIPVRELDAIERYVDSKDRALRGDPATGRAEPLASLTARSSSQKGQLSQHSMNCARSQRVEVPAGCSDLQQWVREARTVEERAERARAATYRESKDLFAHQNHRLCIFKHRDAQANRTRG